LSRLEPTPEEAKAIRALKRVAKDWPDSLWLFSAAGTLTVMRKGPDGGHVHNGENVDQSFIVDTIDIENDGGDW
jgi:hypothetical protein